MSIILARVFIGFFVGNTLIARLLHHGLVGWPKTLTFLAIGVVGFVLVGSPGRPVRRLRRVTMTITLGFSAVALMAALSSETASLVPSWLLAALFFVLSAVLSFRIAPLLAVISLVLISVILGMRAVDTVWGLTLPDIRMGSTPGPFVGRDPVLGYAAIPGFDGRAYRFVDEQESYDVKVTIDEHGRRAAPPDSSVIATNHAVFMGCSFVFGEGVDDWETLPVHVASQVPSCSSYNYGLGGYGPQHMLRMLQVGDLPAEIPEQHGVLLYCLQPFHIDRAIGSYIFLKWGRFSPCYELRGYDLLFKGLFSESRPSAVRAVDLIEASRTLDWAMTRLDLSLSYRNALYYRDGIPLTVMIIAESARLYEEQFNGRLVVAVWPNYDPRTSVLTRELSSHGIPVVDLTEEGLNVPGPDEIVPLDGHPTGAYYQRTAAILARLIEPYLVVQDSLHREEQSE